MSFQEKSAWVVLVSMIVVYGWYFFEIVEQVGVVPIGDIDYQRQMFGTVITLVVLLIAGHIAVAAVSEDLDDRSDERDKAIDRYGEYVGGFVLGFGTLVTLGLTMLELPHFFIANVLLFALVLSEIVSGTTKALLYRRGTVSW